MDAQIWRRLAAVATWLAAAGGILFLWCFLPPVPNPWMLNLTRNPDKFFLWGTMTHFDHTFTYDPHAADEWRVEHFVVPTASMLSTNSQANR